MEFVAVDMNGEPVPQDELMTEIDYLLLDDEALMMYAMGAFDKTWTVGPQGVQTFQFGQPSVSLHPVYSFMTFSILLGADPNYG